LCSASFLSTIHFLPRHGFRLTSSLMNQKTTRERLLPPTRTRHFRQIVSIARHLNGSTRGNGGSLQRRETPVAGAGWLRQPFWWKGSVFLHKTRFQAAGWFLDAHGYSNLFRKCYFKQILIYPKILQILGNNDCLPISGNNNIIFDYIAFNIMLSSITS
jgi:hypothetical protein